MERIRIFNTVSNNKNSAIFKGSKETAGPLAFADITKNAIVTPYVFPVTYKKTQNKEASLGNKILGILTGLAVTSFIVRRKKITNPIHKRLKCALSPRRKDLPKVEEAAARALKELGLQEKGIEITKISYGEAGEAAQSIIDAYFNKYRILKPLQKHKAIITQQLENFFYTIARGDNAGYCAIVKKIFMPEEFLCLSAFHEIGHAMNNNFSIIGKTLQTLRYSNQLAWPIFTIALLKNPKNPDKKPKNNLDKFETFVKNNTGKLTFAAFTPMLLEEFMASAKGYKYARKYLKPELYKNIPLGYSLAFSTYLTSAALISASIYLGGKARDAVANNQKG